MPDHDPMCWYADPDKIPAAAVNDGWPCICDLIAKVRETTPPSCVCKFGRGYAAAIRDAVEAVAKYENDFLEDSPIRLGMGLAKDTIEALGGER